MSKLKDFIKDACTGLDAIQRAPIVEDDTGLKCLRIQDLSQSKPYDKWGNTSANINTIKPSLIKKYDNFIARTGSTIGCNIYFDKDIFSVFNNGLIRLRTNEDMSAKYLHYLMSTSAFQTYVKGISMSSATQPNMKICDLLNYELIVPDVNIQQHIVNISWRNNYAN